MPEVWRWDDELATEPVSVRPSWATHGKHAPVEPDETAVYAVAVRFGPLLLWTVDADGKPQDGPHAERESVRVLYVSGDGSRALERCYDAVRGQDGWTPDRSEFVARFGATDDELADVQNVDNRRRNRTLLRELYDIVEENDSGVTGGPCPRCDSEDVRRSPEFNSTLCADCGAVFRRSGNGVSIAGPHPATHGGGR